VRRKAEGQGCHQASAVDEEHEFAVAFHSSIYSPLSPQEAPVHTVGNTASDGCLIGALVD